MTEESRKIERNRELKKVLINVYQCLPNRDPKKWARMVSTGMLGSSIGSYSRIWRRMSQHDCIDSKIPVIVVNVDLVSLHQVFHSFLHYSKEVLEAFLVLFEALQNDFYRFLLSWPPLVASSSSISWLMILIEVCSY